MAAVVGAVPGVRDIVHVGGAAGALARSLAAASPGLRQELVEISPDVVAVAREHLGLRRAPGLRVRVADGREFVAARGDLSVDAVLIDAFDGALVPAHLVSEAAFADVARVLRAGGVAAVNVVDARGLPSTRAIAAAAASSFSHVALVGPSAVVHGRQSGNAIVVARREPIPEDRIRTLVARDPSPATLVRAAGMPSRAERRVATHRTA
jgi:spermidine synthase